MTVVEPAEAPPALDEAVRPEDPAAGVAPGGGEAAWPPPAATPPPPPPPAAGPAAPGRRAAPRRRPGVSYALWLVGLLVGIGLVAYALGPFLQERDQRRLLARFRVETEQAAHIADDSSGQVLEPGTTNAPRAGQPVAVLEIGALGFQQVVVEGAGSSETRLGPGHVPGTAGLGQPGNSVVVGRRGAFGGSFGDIRHLQAGERIGVVTTQGESVYEVTSAEVVVLGDGSDGDPSVAPIPDDATGGGGGSVRTVAADEVYGPSAEHQLTLVTSASRRPWNGDAAVVVVAEMLTRPFEPTPQGTRSPDDLGRTGERGAVAATVLALVLLGAAQAGSIVLHTRFPSRTALLLSTAPVIASAIIVAETFTRLLPAWM